MAQDTMWCPAYGGRYACDKYCMNQASCKMATEKEREPLRRLEIMNAINGERQWQDAKHGVLEAHGHTVGEWILIMEAELAEAKEALLKGGTGRNAVMHEILQVVATGVAALEQHGLGELSTKWGER